MGLFRSPAGWMSLGGILFMLGMGVYIYLFLREKMREEEQDKDI